MDGSTEKAAYTRSEPKSGRRRVGGSPRSRAKLEARRSMTLRALAARLNGAAVHGPDVEFSGLATESARVRPGDLFVLLEGHGAADLTRAYRRGAAAVLVDADHAERFALSGSWVQAEDILRALGQAANHLQARPSHRMRVAMVTGAVNRRVAAVLVKAALAGTGRTAAHVIEGDERPGSHHLMARLRSQKDQGFQDVLVEAPSAEIALGRFEAVRSEVVLHLGSGQARLNAESKDRLDREADLLRSLPRSSVAVLCADDAAFDWLVEETTGRVVTYGLSRKADVEGHIVSMGPRGAVLRVKTPLGEATVETALVGRSQLQAFLGSLATALALGAELELALSGLAAVSTIPGRLERLAVPEPYNVYLHGESGEASLEAQLESLRPFVKGRMWVVLGSRRGVDTQAAQALARTTERFADILMVTAGPGEEEASLTVVQQLVAGVECPDRVLFADTRSGAIHGVLERLRQDDALVVIGGEDMSGDRTHVFSWFLDGLTRGAVGA